MNGNSPRRNSLLWALAICCGCPVLHADDGDSLRQRRQRHEQARAAATELVETVLDLQLQRLSENGLEDLPVYAELRDSRDAIQQLATVEMSELSNLLLSADQSAEDLRAEQIQAARALARRIATQLLSQRQRVRRRLQVSRVAELLQQMVGSQEKNLAATEALLAPAATATNVTAAQLAQNQLDIRLLFDQLVESLRADVATAAAAERQILAMLEQKPIANRLDSAARLLEQNDLRSAAAAERDVAAALTQAIAIVESAQGLHQLEREAALQAIAAARQQQAQVRERTGQTNLNEPAQRDPLVAEQRQIREQLESLRQPLAELAPIGEQALATWDAAREAERHLANGDQAAALERQETVLRMLDDMTQQLSAAPVDLDALADEARQLESLESDLSKLVEQQDAVGELAASDPQTARNNEQLISESLATADRLSQVDEAIESRLDDAQQAIADALDTLRDESDLARAARLEATDQAQQSLMEAAAETQSQLAALRQTLAAAASSASRSALGDGSNSQPSTGATRDTGGNARSSASDPITRRNLEDEPWFTRLPPATQQMLRTGTRPAPPRGYEDRLRRYFGAEE